MPFIPTALVVVMPICAKKRWTSGCCSKKSAPHDAFVRSAKIRGAKRACYFLVLFSLLPMTPPRIAPAAPPMIAPFTLFWLVTAPITAPAPAPIAASRVVCLTTTGAGAGALYTGAEEYVPDERRVVVVLRTVVCGAVVVLLSEFDAGAVATPARSAAVMLSSGVYGRACAAVERSEFKASSAFLSPPHAKAKSAAGRISIFLNILKPPVMTPAQRDGTTKRGRERANMEVWLGHCSGG